MNWYLEVLKKYAVFGGRARRKEYWMFALFNLIIMFVLGLIEGYFGIAPETEPAVFAYIYQLAVLIPTIAVGVRRMHDTNHSGWWLLLPIVNFVFLVSEGTQGDNRFGSDPKTILQTGTGNDAPRRPAPPSTKSQADPLETMQRLGELRDAGIISEDEFEKKKMDLLDRI